jgi:hypothetical protein
MSSRNGYAIVRWRSSERAVFDLPPDVLGKLLVIAPLIGVARVVAARRGVRVLWGAAMALMVVAAAAGILLPEGYTLSSDEFFGYELYPHWIVLAVGGVPLFLHGALVIRLRPIYQYPASVLIGASLLRVGLEEWIV